MKQFEELRSEIQNTDIGNEQHFLELFNKAIDVLKISNLELSDRFDVGISEILKWKNGQIHPRPTKRTLIYNFLFKRIPKKIHFVQTVFSDVSIAKLNQVLDENGFSPSDAFLEIEDETLNFSDNEFVSRILIRAERYETIAEARERTKKEKI